jgi:lauroyl/myristoyl acyltransferase
LLSVGFLLAAFSLNVAGLDCLAGYETKKVCHLVSDTTRYIEPDDVVLVGVISLLTAATWVLPERHWPGFSERLARVRSGLRGSLSEEELSTIRVIVGGKPSRWISDDFWPSSLGHKYLSWMQILACHPPRRWTPKPRLIGKEHLERALAKGRGAILLNAGFAYRDLMTKAAMAAAGHAGHQLSMDTHGFSRTRFGKRWLNPIYTSVEKRFLQERMLFSGDNTKEIRDTIRARLNQNKPVMIAVTPLGRRVETRPFLQGYIHIATGGMNLACENGASVLPVFTLREADGGISTIIGAALDQPEDGDPAKRIGAMLDDYVPRLESHVRAHPSQFLFPLTSRSGRPLISPCVAEADDEEAPIGSAAVRV